MQERPILFSAPMVRALLAGTKTQTRRIVKPQPYVDAMGNACWNGWNFGQDTTRRPLFDSLASPIPSSTTKRVHCPYGAPGDRLWVRETWMEDYSAPERRALYRAAWGNVPDGQRWRSSIHMPRWASRITLEITSVRVERLQDISESDAATEGVEHVATCWIGATSGRAYSNARDAFEDIWIDINGIDSWDANPWVWVLTFRRVEAA